MKKALKSLFLTLFIGGIIVFGIFCFFLFNFKEWSIWTPSFVELICIFCILLIVISGGAFCICMFIDKRAYSQKVLSSPVSKKICPNCNINISSDCKVCPNCKKEI